VPSHDHRVTSRARNSSTDQYGFCSLSQHWVKVNAKVKFTASIRAVYTAARDAAVIELAHGRRSRDTCSVSGRSRVLGARSRDAASFPRGQMTPVAFFGGGRVGHGNFNTPAFIQSLFQNPHPGCYSIPKNQYPGIYSRSIPKHRPLYEIYSKTNTLALIRGLRVNSIGLSMRLVVVLIEELLFEGHVARHPFIEISSHRVTLMSRLYFHAHVELHPGTPSLSHLYTLL
jgi:hypothetical protein